MKYCVQVELNFASDADRDTYKLFEDTWSSGKSWWKTEADSWKPQERILRRWYDLQNDGQSFYNNLKTFLLAPPPEIKGTVTGRCNFHHCKHDGDSKQFVNCRSDPSFEETKSGIQGK